MPRPQVLSATKGSYPRFCQPQKVLTVRVCTTGGSSYSRSRFLPRFEVFAAVLVCTPVQGSRSDFKILAAVRLVVVTAVRFYVGSRFYTSAVQDFQVDHDSTELSVLQRFNILQTEVQNHS